MTSTESYVCHARPAHLGGECGRLVTKPLRLSFGDSVRLCCEWCGCTKKASDDRTATTPRVGPTRRKKD